MVEMKMIREEEEVLDGPPRRPKSTTQSKEKTQNQQVLAELKAGHRAWDDMKKNIMACVAKAQDDPYVAPKLVADLNSTLKQVNEQDDKLRQQEVQEKNGQVWNESDCQAIRDMLRLIKNDMDSARRIMKKVEAIIKDECTNRGCSSVKGATVIQKTTRG